MAGIEAAIDIGTNTMLLLVAEVKEELRAPRRLGRVLDDQIRFVRLGEAVHRNRRFAPEAMERARKCFREFHALCDKHRAGRIHAVATSASRDSANAMDFYAEIKKETGIDTRVIPGEMEARLSFLGGLLPGMEPSSCALIDIGGGSTEFVTGHTGGEGIVVNAQSTDMGCVRATEMYLKGDPYEPASLAEMERDLASIWPQLGAGLKTELREKEWTGIAGTPTTLAALALGLESFEPAKVDGYRIGFEAVRDWYGKLSRMTQSARASNPLMGTGRGDIMVAGVAILLTAMKHFEKSQILVSSRGLRHGVLLNPS